MQKKNILQTIAGHAAVRVQTAKAIRSLEEIRSEALSLTAEQNRLCGRNKEDPAAEIAPDTTKENVTEIMPDSSEEHTAEITQDTTEEYAAKTAPETTAASVLPPFAFEHALRGDDIAFICECKKASPSKGLIAPDFPYLKIAREYEVAGAACISVLTEPKWFLGENRYLKEIADTVSIPCLRKDFVVDEYMLYEARLLNASAALLIVSLLAEDTLRRYIKICDELGMSALVEAHDEMEIRTALQAGARVIGVNNRNLKDFSVDFENSRRLRAMVPKDILFVAESGVRTADDIRVLCDTGADAVLIGETLMRAADKTAMLNELRGRPSVVTESADGLNSLTNN